jgi:hypothetical protein
MVITHSLRLQLNNAIRRAYYSLNDFAASVTAFQQGLDLEPNNASFQSELDQARARLVCPFCERDSETLRLV